MVLVSGLSVVSGSLSPVGESPDPLARHSGLSDVDSALPLNTPLHCSPRSSLPPNTPHSVHTSVSLLALFPLPRTLFPILLK